MIRALIATAAVCCVSVSLAETLTAPTYQPNDRWTYRVTEEKGPSGWSQSSIEFKVIRASGSSLYFSTHPLGSTQPPKELVEGLDWSRRRDVNGHETVVNQPLAFPLTVGQTWEIHYVEQHPNKAHRSEEWVHHYTVIGHEGVDVPAGHFDAIKVEAEGRWTAELEPTQTVAQSAQTSANGTTMVTQAAKTEAEPVAGRTYKAFWYVPSVKRWVKSVEEYYSAGGVRNERYTQELESVDLHP